MQQIIVKRNLTANTDRGPSGSIWADCPMDDLNTYIQNGLFFKDDFLMSGNLTTTNAIGSMGQWATWADTSCVLGTDPQQDGGVILLSDAANITKNITLGSTAGGFRMVSAATNNPLINAKLWFECRVAVGSITTTKRDAFIGLVDNTTSFSTASATGVINAGNALQTVPNLFGFHFRSSTNPTDVGLAFNVAGGTVQYPTNLQTLSTTVAGAALTAFAAGATGALATGFVKLGFVYDPFAQSRLISSASSGQTVGNTAKPLITIFVNGQPAAAFLSSTNVVAATFPTGWMAPTISYTSRAATASGGFYVDWIQVAQIANT
jgi:hypothetical protein